MLHQKIQGDADSPGPAHDAVVLASGAVLPGGAAPGLFRTHSLADHPGEAQRQLVRAVLIVIGPVNHGVVHALRSACVGVQGKEQVAALRQLAPGIHVHLSVDGGAGGEHLEPPGFQLLLQL